MSYFVTVTFDLRDATSQQYDQVADRLSQMGFNNTLSGDSGRTVNLPTTTFAGKFTGASAAKVRDDLSDRVRDVLTTLGLHGRLFVFVGDGWAWGSRTT
jgi:hypothetical protein